MKKTVTKTAAKKSVAKKTAAKRKLTDEQLRSDLKIAPAKRNRLDAMADLQQVIATESDPPDYLNREMRDAMRERLKKKAETFAKMFVDAEPQRLEPAEAVVDTLPAAVTEEENSNLKAVDVQKSIEEIVRFAKLFEGPSLSEDCETCEKFSDGICDFCKKFSNMGSGVVLETIDTLSPLTKEINAAHKQLIDFEKIYAQLKAKQIVTKRKSDHALEAQADDEQALTDAFYEELHARHKFMMIEKILNQLHWDFKSAPLQQETVRTATIHEAVGSLVEEITGKNGPTPKPSVTTEPEPVNPVLELMRLKRKMTQDEMAETGRVGIIYRAR